MTSDHQPLGPHQQALVTALRSGHYQQGVRKLLSPQGFCCLGVAADIAGARWCQSSEKDPREAGLDLCPWFTGLSDELVQLYSFRTSEGRYGESHETLSMLNDSGDWGFAEIASFIEANASRVFREPK